MQDASVTNVLWSCIVNLPAGLKHGEKATMDKTNEINKFHFVVGVVGIFALLIGALVYAAWESGSHYQPDRLDQFVEEQATQQSE